MGIVRRAGHFIFRPVPGLGLAEEVDERRGNGVLLVEFVIEGERGAVVGGVFLIDSIILVAIVVGVLVDAASSSAKCVVVGPLTNSVGVVVASIF